jgi:hypothetical protein
MWKRDLEKALRYRLLREYWQGRDVARSVYYSGKYRKYLERFAKEYEAERRRGIRGNSPGEDGEAQIGQAARIRILNAIGAGLGEEIDVWIDGRRVAEGLPFGNVTDRIGLAAGTHRIEVRKRDSGKKVFSSSLAIPSGDSLIAAVGPERGRQRYAFILYGVDPVPVPGETRIRFIHLARGIPAVSVGSERGTVLFRNIRYTEASPYETVEPRFTTLIVQNAVTGQPIATIPNLRFEEGQVLTVVGLISGKRFTSTIVNDR